MATGADFCSCPKHPATHYVRDHALLDKRIAARKLASAAKIKPVPTPQPVPTPKPLPTSPPRAMDTLPASPPPLPEAGPTPIAEPAQNKSVPRTLQARPVTKSTLVPVVGEAYGTGRATTTIRKNKTPRMRTCCRHTTYDKFWCALCFRYGHAIRRCPDRCMRSTAKVYHAWYDCGGCLQTCMDLSQMKEAPRRCMICAHIGHGSIDCARACSICKTSTSHHSTENHFLFMDAPGECRRCVFELNTHI